MRIYSIIYYTDNQNKFFAFKETQKQKLITASNRGTVVDLLDSFVVEGTTATPLFCSTRDLSIHLENYDKNLSDLTVIVDCDFLESGRDREAATKLRDIIFEYAEVKFLFDTDSDKIPDVLFKIAAVKDTIKNADIALCDKYLKIFREALEKEEAMKSLIDKLNKYSKEKKDKKEKYNIPDEWLGICLLLNSTKELSYDEKTVSSLRKRIIDHQQNLIRRKAILYVNFSLLSLPSTNNYDFFLEIVHSKDNLFDASNLRYAIKQWKYAHLNVEEQNYAAIQFSRRDNLAVCVEEERGQNRFNSYCLYTAGFRVLPITCAAELSQLNEDEKIKPAIILRDYDLQFPDSSKINYETDSQQGAIKAIRGFRDTNNGTWEIHVFKSPCWSRFYKTPSIHSSAINSLIHFHFPLSAIKYDSDSYIIENTTETVPIYFISKGSNIVEVKHPKHFIKMKKGMVSERCFHYLSYSKGKQILNIPGLIKPISGIIHPFLDIPVIRKRFTDSRKNNKDYCITRRIGHSHGTSLDVYSTVTSIIKRAHYYYEKGKYIHAAVLSGEAMEYLNGFHQALMIEAYYINAISENAIAMDAMVKEKDLVKDCSIRVDKIRQDVERIYAQEGLSKRKTRALAVNALNQIYSDCRVFCRLKEHFNSESVFIGAMGRLNEGSFIISKHFGL